MELQANPGSLGLTRFLPWNQSPGRGFFFCPDSVEVS